MLSQPPNLTFLRLTFGVKAIKPIVQKYRGRRTKNETLFISLSQHYLPTKLISNFLMAELLIGLVENSAELSDELTSR